MVVHSRFVVVTLLGKRSQWGAQQRGDYGFGWRSAWSVHGVDTLIGLLWGGIVYLLAPGFFWWLTPVLTGLVLSMPLSVYTSRKTMGQRARRWGLFLIPEETRSFPLLDNLNANEVTQARHGGFVQAVVDPFVNALHLRLLKRESGYSRRPWVEREQLVRKASDRGLDSLTDREKNGLLSDAQALAQLHLQMGGQGKHSS
jgi:membrane glycosyltransferase